MAYVLLNVSQTDGIVSCSSIFGNSTDKECKACKPQQLNTLRDPVVTALYILCLESSIYSSESASIIYNTYVQFTGLFSKVLPDLMINYSEGRVCSFVAIGGIYMILLINRLVLAVSSGLSPCGSPHWGVPVS